MCIDTSNKVNSKKYNDNYIITRYFRICSLFPNFTSKNWVIYETL